MIAYAMHSRFTQHRVNPLVVLDFAWKCDEEYKLHLCYFFTMKVSAQSITRTHIHALVSAPVRTYMDVLDTHLHVQLYTLTDCDFLAVL